MVILVTDRVGEEHLGMVTIFCHHDQNKMKAFDALSALCQHDSPEPSVVVVMRYTNTPYIPWGTTRLLYLDVSTLSGSPSSCLCLQRLLLYSKTKVLLGASPYEEEGMESKVYPYIWEVLWKRSEEEHHLSDPVSLSIPSPSVLPFTEKRHSDWGGISPQRIRLQPGP